MRHQCPICLFPDLPYPPVDYHICPCCGTEFGNDDAGFSHEQLREMWVAAGAWWFFGRPPENWNPWVQLIDGGHPEIVPQIETKLVALVNLERTSTVFYEQPDGVLMEFIVGHA